MTQEEEVILANESYYQAFAGGDYQIMTAVWASDHDVSIIHYIIYIFIFPLA